MDAVKNRDDLLSIKEEYLRRQKSYRRQVLVCGGAGCISSNCGEVRDALIKSVSTYKLDDEVKVMVTGCMGTCAMGPVILVEPEGIFYTKMNPEKAEDVVARHLLKDEVCEEYTYFDEDEGVHVPRMEDIPFFKGQVRVALRNCGHMEYASLEAYISRDGYGALARALSAMTPARVVEEMKASGLRGRGGAGFPTGVKWEAGMKAVSEDGRKFMVCNADEGDPGAFMDRSVLEGDPHAVLEAMAIAGYAIGANQGYIYVRAEYPIAVERLQIAIKQARDMELLGKNIFGTGFDFDIDLRLGAGAFVCGEETALMTSIEGKRGEPRPRPPFPAQKGLFGKPSILNNVETYANIPQIILNGPEWFASMGTEKSKGTKVFALGGKINNTGLVEVPMGTTLRTVIEEIGGGIPGGKKFKAAQTGGPSGGCIPAEHFDIPIDYDNLIAIGSMMGSGGLIVMDEDDCMVDIAKFFLEFTVEESCGKCTACRIGTKRMLEILTKITKGQADMADLDKLEELCYYVKNNSLCGLGQTAPNPVLSTLRYFRDEYEAHIKEKRCPAGVCKALLSYNIDRDKCRGCTLCARTCPAGAIIGSVKNPHIIDQNKCIKCGACMEKCKFGAIYKK